MKNDKRKVMVICGPTGSGKTSLSIDLAKKIDGEIVNFDSLLFYRELNIGTAKPQKMDREEIVHHLIDVRSARDPLNSADFSKLAVPLINHLLEKQKPVLLVGGSGFYLRSLLRGMAESSTSSKEIISRSENLYLDKGIGPFREILFNEDQASYLKFHENDHYRIRRAVEHFWSNQTPFSQKTHFALSSQFLTNRERFQWDVNVFYLDIPKIDHELILKLRIREMLEKGLIDEVKGIYQIGFTGKEKPLQSIGYKETQEFIQGKISTLESLQEKIFISHRQLAKAQRTWFKKYFELSFNPLNDREDLLKKMVDAYLGEGHDSKIKNDYPF